MEFWSHLFPEEPGKLWQVQEDLFSLHKPSLELSFQSNSAGTLAPLSEEQYPQFDSRIHVTWLLSSGHLKIGQDIPYEQSPHY